MSSASPVVEISGFVPCSLTVIEPCPVLSENRTTPVTGDNPNPSDEGSEKSRKVQHGSSCDVAQSSADALLKALATALSCWYLEMRDVVGRGRGMQAQERVRLGLPKHAKVQWTNPGMTKENEAVSSAMRAVVDAMFGSQLAEYASERFKSAVETGDMRSFKLRLLMLRARDSLKGSEMYVPFANGVDSAIAYAEQRAGCVPCPGPRRMSKAEQARHEILEREGKTRPRRKHLQQEEAPEPPESPVEDVAPTEEPGETPRKPEEPRPIDDDALARDVARGKISPGRALLMMLSRPPKQKRQRKRRPMKKQDGVDLEKMADEILMREYGTNFKENEDGGEYGNPDALPFFDDDLVDDDVDDQADEDRPTYQSRRRGYGSLGYGRYNASGTEWCPDDE